MRSVHAVPNLAKSLIVVARRAFRPLQQARLCCKDSLHGSDLLAVSERAAEANLHARGRKPRLRRSSTTGFLQRPTDGFILTTLFRRVLCVKSYSWFNRDNILSTTLMCWPNRRRATLIGGQMARGQGSPVRDKAEWLLRFAVMTRRRGRKVYVRRAISAPHGRAATVRGSGDVETIVCVPYHAIPNFAKSLIVVARRGVSDAPRRSIVSRG